MRCRWKFAHLGIMSDFAWNWFRAGQHVNYTGLRSSSSSDVKLSFIVSNPFVTLIQLNAHTTSLTFAHSTGIHENGTSHNDIKVKTLQENGSKVKISGNILLLVPSQSNDLTNLESSPLMTWIWNGGYLKTASIIPGLDVTTQKVIEISTLGSLIEVINPNVVNVSSHLTGDKTSEVNTSGLTWSLRQEPLDATMDVIWTHLLEMKMPVSNIILVCADISEQFPYHLDNGKQFFQYSCSITLIHFQVHLDWYARRPRPSYHPLKQQPPQSSVHAIANPLTIFIHTWADTFYKPSEESKNPFPFPSIIFSLAVFVDARHSLIQNVLSS